ncbi:ATP-binding protein [Konateibacter massiliensis]|uniref:ATP-binding protein n=1 Tax=Konateibacter massiliensis TaxID=2002841 RepID=UPI000C148289|nr:ATP-binding protein [Konateibacter massiliensis]
MELGIKDFNEETIRQLFGNEAAEDENIDRLLQYYVKGDIYEKMSSSIPLYILVGHKGVGKSALLKILQKEDVEKENISISIQPDDIIELDIHTDNFNKRIRDWKDGLSKIIFQKIIESISTSDYLNRNPWVEKFSTLLFSIVGKKVNELQKETITMSSKDFTTLFKNIIFTEKIITVYIDDLDRGWENTQNDIKNISALLNSIRDLSREIPNLRFRVALRSDVYYSVRTSDESTDKIEGCVLWQYWSNHEIMVMLIKRIETYFGRDINEKELLEKKQKDIKHYLDSVFEERFKGKGHWDNAPIYQVLMSLIRKRPRDLIKLCTLAARNAKKFSHSKIQTSDLEESFNEYSAGRLQDTINEYASELTKIEDLLLKMRPTKKELESGSPCLFSRDKLINKLNNILSMSNYTFNGNKVVTAQNLAAFLYKINFLTARKDKDEEIQRSYYDENRYLANEFSDFGYSYEIHPAYRWALQPSNIEDLFYQISLEE